MTYSEGVALPVVVCEAKRLLPTKGGGVPLGLAGLQVGRSVGRDVAGRLWYLLHLQEDRWAGMVNGEYVSRDKDNPLAQHNMTKRKFVAMLLLCTNMYSCLQHRELRKGKN